MPTKTLATRIAVIETDIKQWSSLFGRLDVSIEKITELNVSIKEVLAVHEQRLSTAESDVERTYDTFEEKYEQLHSRISTVNRELINELKDADKQVMDAVNSVHRAVDQNAQDAEVRIRSLEKRQWMMMGAAAVLGFLLGNAARIQALFN